MGIPLTRRAMLQRSAGLLAAGTAYSLVSARGTEPQRRAAFLPSLYDAPGWPFIAWWNIATKPAAICRIFTRG